MHKAIYSSFCTWPRSDNRIQRVYERLLTFNLNSVQREKRMNIKKKPKFRKI